MSDEPQQSASDLLADLQSDDPVTAMKALRSVLAIQLVSADDPSKAASVGKVLRDVHADLASMVKPEGSKTDALAARRAARRSTPAPDAAAGGDDGGGGRSGRARGKRGAAS